MWARLSSGLAGSEPTQTHCGSPARVVPPRRKSQRRQWSSARHRINTTTKSWRSISDERHLVSRNRVSGPGSSQARQSGALRRRRRSRADNLDGLYSDAIHVRSVRPPEPGRVVGLQLYFPNFKEAVAPLSIVAERTSGANPGFWAEFAGNDGAKDRIAALLALHRERPSRSCRRFHTHLQASIRQRGQPQSDGHVTNISQTGAFVRLESLPPNRVVVELDLS